jgi:type VI secretion system secreted protein VgrG
MMRQLSHRLVLALALTSLALTGLASPAVAQERRPTAGGTFDLSKFPTQRREIDGMRSEGFPNLGKNYEVLKPGTSTYNCIAWSLGITDEWIWPGTSVQTFDKLNAKHGFKPLSKLDYKAVPGVEKIVLYGKTVNGRLVATHQARQMPDGTWTSKLGKMAVIRHATPDSLDGPDYGKPVAVYARKK